MVCASACQCEVELVKCIKISSVLPPPVQDDQTALHIASRKGHDRIVEILLRREADVNHQERVRLPVYVSLVITHCISFPGLNFININVKVSQLISINLFCETYHSL